MTFRERLQKSAGIVTENKSSVTKSPEIQRLCELANVKNRVSEGLWDDAKDKWDDIKADTKHAWQDLKNVPQDFKTHYDIAKEKSDQVAQQRQTSRDAMRLAKKHSDEMEKSRLASKVNKGVWQKEKAGPKFRSTFTPSPEAKRKALSTPFKSTFDFKDEKAVAEGSGYTKPDTFDLDRENPNQNVDSQKHWDILSPEYREKLERNRRLAAAKQYIDSQMFHARVKASEVERQRQKDMAKFDPIIEGDDQALQDPQGLNRRQRRDLSNQLKGIDDRADNEKAKKAADDYLRKTDPSWENKKQMAAKERARLEYLADLKAKFERGELSEAEMLEGIAFDPEKYGKMDAAKLKADAEEKPDTRPWVKSTPMKELPRAKGIPLSPTATGTPLPKGKIAEPVFGKKREEPTPEGEPWKLSSSTKKPTDQDPTAVETDALLEEEESLEEFLAEMADQIREESTTASVQGYSPIAAFSAKGQKTNRAIQQSEKEGWSRIPKEEIREAIKELKEDRLEFEKRIGEAVAAEFGTDFAQPYLDLITQLLMDKLFGNQVDESGLKYRKHPRASIASSAYHPN
jgi:hypothetical protein